MKHTNPNSTPPERLDVAVIILDELRASLDRLAHELNGARLDEEGRARKPGRGLILDAIGLLLGLVNPPTSEEERMMAERLLRLLQKREPEIAAVLAERLRHRYLTQAQGGTDAAG